jgi:hypothetical protein
MGLFVCDVRIPGISIISSSLHHFISSTRSDPEAREREHQKEAAVIELTYPFDLPGSMHCIVKHGRSNSRCCALLLTFHHKRSKLRSSQGVSDGI